MAANKGTSAATMLLLVALFNAASVSNLLPQIWAVGAVG